MLLLCTCEASVEPLESLGGNRTTLTLCTRKKTPDFTCLSQRALNRTLWALSCVRPAFCCYRGGRDRGTLLRQVCCPFISYLFVLWPACFTGAQTRAFDLCLVTPTRMHTRASRYRCMLANGLKGQCQVLCHRVLNAVVLPQVRGCGSSVACNQHVQF
jgi:hypothetical protein